MSARRSFLTTAEVVAFWVAQLLVGGTGVGLLLLRLQPPPEDAFATVPPSFPLWQHAHVVLAPALVFLLGVVWARHAAPSLRAHRPRRLSGTTLLVLAAAMVASGYGLQVSVDEGPREGFRLLHSYGGLLWLLTGLLHLLGPPGRNGTAA